MYDKSRDTLLRMMKRSLTEMFNPSLKSEERQFRQPRMEQISRAFSILLAVSGATSYQYVPFAIETVGGIIIVLLCNSGYE